ncbi:hypothetical protein SLA2020_360140 [Shorea laevis]
MDEFAVDEIMEEVAIDFNSENAVEKFVEEEEEIDIEFSGENAVEEIMEEEGDVFPIREVRLTLPTTDDLELPVLTF